MKKNLMLSIVVVLLILGMGITPVANGQTITKDQEKSIMDSSSINIDWFLGDQNDDNHWTPEDEGDHFPCGCEWWWIYATLTLDNGKHWDVALMFNYWMGRTRDGYEPGLSFYRVQCWNRESGDCYDLLYEDREYPNPYFHHSKNEVNLKYYNCSMKGLYPNYVIYAEDYKNDISFNLKYHAESIPSWVADESTDGLVPYGLSGVIRYGCIPRSRVTGNISIKGTDYNVTGVGYYEHQFGDMNVISPFKIPSVKELLYIKTLYSQLRRWWTKEVITNKREPLRSIHLSTDSLLGYDWIWATFDNGYSIVLFRVSVFGWVEGRVLAVLMLTDGKTCWEFGDVYIDYKDTLYIEKYDIYIPRDMEITAYKGAKVLNIVFNSTTEMNQAHDHEEKIGSYLLAGNVTGYFNDGEKNHSMKGVGTNAPARYLPKLKYRSLEVDVVLPPHGFGISLRKVSHRLGLERFFKIQLRPFEFEFYIKPVPDI